MYGNIFLQTARLSRQTAICFKLVSWKYAPCYLF
jgi:hypothetical protein